MVGEEAFEAVEGAMCSSLNGVMVMHSEGRDFTSSALRPGRGRGFRQVHPHVSRG